MSQLKELIERELKGRDSAKVDLHRLEQTVGDQKCILMYGGLYTPNVGVFGDWSPEEKKAVRRIIEEGKQDQDLGHHIERSVTGHHNPLIARYKPAYSTLNGMRAGDIARVRVGEAEQEYLLAAFRAELPATSLVLFVK